MKSANKVVFPYPAGAESNTRRLSVWLSSHSSRRGRGSRSGRGRGTRNLVLSRMEGFIYGYYSGVVKLNSRLLNSVWFANDLQMRDDTIT